jgi:hypothetical protein
VNSEDQQLIALALAELQLRRPGWDYAISECAKRNNIPQQFIDQFRRTSQDIVTPQQLAGRTTADELETLMSFIQWLRTEYKLMSEQQTVHRSYNRMLLPVQLTDSQIIGQYVARGMK